MRYLLQRHALPIKAQLKASLVLAYAVPADVLTPVDIYDPAEMTEPSIVRARRMYPATEPFVVGTFDHLPLPTGDQDEVFLLFAAHEVRAPERRSQLVRESSRVLNAGGQVLLVEHLRDWPNFLAFGPGFLHFHSERTWRKNIQEAGLMVERENTITPFVHCFFLRKVDG